MVRSSLRFIPIWCIPSCNEVRADYEFEHGRPAGALNVPAFFSTAQGMTVNPDFVDQVTRACFWPLLLVQGSRVGVRGAGAEECNPGLCVFVPCPPRDIARFSSRPSTAVFSLTCLAYNCVIRWCLSLYPPRYGAPPDCREVPGQGGQARHWMPDGEQISPGRP